MFDKNLFVGIVVIAMGLQLKAMQSVYSPAHSFTDKKLILERCDQLSISAKALVYNFVHRMGIANLRAHYPAFKQETPYEALVRLLLEDKQGAFTLLRKMGADVFKPALQGETILHRFVINRDVQMVGQLLVAGININTMNLFGETALYCAAAHGDEDMVRLLLSQAADVHKADAKGITPLYRAVINSKKNVMLMLLDAGAGAEMPPRMNIRGLLVAAASKGYERLVGELLEMLHPDEENEYGRTPLVVAAANGHVEVVRLVLRRGADPEKSDPNGGTPLFWAANNGHLAVVELLLDTGLDLDRTTKSIYLSGNGPNNRHSVSENILESLGSSLRLRMRATSKSIDGSTALAAAAARGHLEIVRLLLARGANFDKADAHGATPLHEAAAHGHLQLVNLLLDGGADCTKPDCYGATPLIRAADEGQEATSYLLLRRKAFRDLNSVELAMCAAARHGHMSMIAWCETCFSRRTKVDTRWHQIRKLAAWNAAKYGRVNVVQFFLDAGLSIDSSTGSRILLLAASNGHEEMVSFLLKKGADTRKQDVVGLAPLNQAMSNGYFRVSQLLVEAGATIDRFYGNPLCGAVRSGNLDLVNLCLSCGADVNKREESDTPLSLAAERGHAEIASLLLLRGANPSTSGSSDKPLISAVRNGHVEVARLLLATGVRKERTQDGKTLLDLAKENNDAPMIGLLSRPDEPLDDIQRRTRESSRNASLSSNYLLDQAIEEGDAERVRILLAQDRYRIPYEGTSLNLAARSGHLNVIRVLLTARLGINEINCEGWTALSVAAEKGDSATVSFLLENHAETETFFSLVTPLFVAAQNGHVKVVKLLLDAGAKRDAVDVDGTTPLCIAVQNGHFNVVELLLEAGADINATSSNGVTPLVIAAYTGYYDIVKLLVERGADIEKVTKEGYSPLYAAAHAGYACIVALLVGSGADSKRITNHGLSAWDIATQKGHMEVIIALIEASDKKRIEEGRLAVASERIRESAAMLVEVGDDFHGDNSGSDSDLIILRNSPKLQRK